MFDMLQKINQKPKPFEFYTADALWTDEHTSEQMLHYHLNESVDVASRNHVFIDRSVDWICSHFNISKAKSIADFGCGPGLYANKLAACGAAVTGIDFSPRSISYARQKSSNKNLKTNYVQTNYVEYNTADKYDLICMIMCDFCALNPAQRSIMLKKFHSFLKPTGAILMDVYSLARFVQIKESSTYEFNQLNGFWSPADYYGFVNTFKYEKEKILLDKYTIVEKDKKKHVYNWLQHFDPDSLKQELLDSGFNNVDYYKNVAGDEFDDRHSEFAVIVR
jgi:SAM-dependent methyltransferase